MRPTSIAALAALALPPPAFAADAPARPAGTVAVYRGSTASVASPVAVYRGSAVRPGYLATPPEAASVEVIGGERIWFVDSATGELTGCRLVSTFTVGVKRVQCTTEGQPFD